MHVKIKKWVLFLLFYQRSEILLEDLKFKIIKYQSSF